MNYASLYLLSPASTISQNFDVVSSGGAARKAGMTREDLLKGNAAIAEEFGKNVKAYCPDVKHVVVIFNPADITGRKLEWFLCRISHCAILWLLIH